MKRSLTYICWASVLLLCLLSACGSNENEDLSNEAVSGSEPVILQSLTTEIPDTLYEITVTNVDPVSLDEQKEVISELSTVLDYEPVFDDIFDDGNGSPQYATTNGGAVAFTKTLTYWGSELACSFMEQDGRGKQIERITVTEDTDLSESYTLSGEEYSIGAAIDYVNELWEESLSEKSLGLDASVSRVIVYELEDGDHAYVLLLDRIYQGLPIEQYSTLVQTNMNESGGFRKSFILVEMDAPDHISTYADLFPIQIVSTEPITNDILTEEEATNRAQSVMANYAGVTIQESKLCYGAFRSGVGNQSEEEWNHAEYVYKPYWCFVLEWGTDEAGGYYSAGYQNYMPNVTLYVDAQTGVAYLLDSIDMTEIQISE